MARQTIAQQFRDKATEEEWKIAVEDHYTLSLDDYKIKYGFTWGAIVDDATEKGLYTKQGRCSQTIIDGNVSKKSPIFYVKDVPENVKKINRSVQLDENIYKRLKSLEQSKGQYTHSAILNQLLDDALKIYGF